MQSQYTVPANIWTDALPIGNGRLGGMIFGGVQQERIKFNEDTRPELTAAGLLNEALTM